jgi:hypothetical protein
MNKILALDPDAIETERDWDKVYPFVDHAKGLFLANYPKAWTKHFLKRDIDSMDWGFWNTEKIKEFLINLEKNNTLVSLNAPYDQLSDWAKNFSIIDNEKKLDCIAFANRKTPHNLNTLDQLDARQLHIDSTIDGKFSPASLIKNLKVFLQNAGKIALVDRHNYLTKPNGNTSIFVEFLRELLLAIKSTKCHEILVYAKYDPDKYTYMQSNELVCAQLNTALNGFITPTYGIKYMCCAEYQNNQDLHSRKIITNNALFSLSDSISGSTYSQSITRIPDNKFREKHIKLWIDEDHGLDIKTSATYINLTHSPKKLFN